MPARQPAARRQPENRHGRAATREPAAGDGTANGGAGRSQSRRAAPRTRTDQPRQHGDRRIRRPSTTAITTIRAGRTRTATARSGSATSTTTRTGGIRGYYGYGTGYGSGYYPRFGSGFGFDIGELRLQVFPRNAQVFVDGYYAGTVDDYDGTFQALKLEAGPYQIRISAPGFEDLMFDVRINPGQKINYKGDLRRAYR